jgi:hypothetical protein
LPGVYNNDGLDPDGCTNVIVRNCFFNTEDDAMCLKGASDRPTENVLIENSTFITTCNALKIGTDTQGDFRNVLARNLVLGGIPDSLVSSSGRQASTGITIATVDGGNVENIYINEVVINQARCPVFIRIGNRLRVMSGLPRPPVGYIQNVFIENVTGKQNFRQGSYIAGIPGQKIDNVIIRNYDIEMEGGGTEVMAKAPVAENEGGYPDAHQFSVSGLPAYGFYIQHASNILFDTVSITPTANDYRPEFITGNDVANVVANGSSVDEQELFVVNYTPKYIKNVVINNSAKDYKVDSVYVGGAMYRDRSYTFTELCDSIIGAEYLCLQNGLKSVYNKELVSFTVSEPGKLYIAHDNRLQKPEWLSEKFTKTNQQFPVPGTNMTLFGRSVQKGEKIVLGENQVKGTETSECTFYFVFFLVGSSDTGTVSATIRSSNEVSIFPIPANDFITINLNGDEYKTVLVYDIKGRLLLSHPLVENRFDLDCKNLLPGIYNLVLVSKNITTTRRFIVN